MLIGGVDLSGERLIQLTASQAEAHLLITESLRKTHQAAVRGPSFTYSTPSQGTCRIQQARYDTLQRLISVIRLGHQFFSNKIAKNACKKKLRVIIEADLQNQFDIFSVSMRLCHPIVRFLDFFLEQLRTSGRTAYTVGRFTVNCLW